MSKILNFNEFCNLFSAILLYNFRVWQHCLRYITRETELNIGNAKNLSFNCHNICYYYSPWILICTFASASSSSCLNDFFNEYFKQIFLEFIFPLKKKSERWNKYLEMSSSTGKRFIDQVDTEPILKKLFLLMNTHPSVFSC